MKHITFSKLQLTIFLSSLIVLMLSFYLQYGKGLEPCPLCLMQRASMIALLLTSASLFFRKQAHPQRWLIIQGIFFVAGLFFASRQLWLMSLPAKEIPACLPGLTILLHYFPLKETFHALFWGSGDCTEIRWTFLGLSLPLWSAVYFIGMGILSFLSQYAYCKEKCPA